MTVPMSEQPNDQYEFVFHDACWYLLQERFRGMAFPLKRLIEVLNSVLLNDARTPDEKFYMWVHGYLGLACFDDQGYYLWEESGWQMKESSVMQNAAEDPCFQQQTVHDLLDSPSIAPP